MSVKNETNVKTVRRHLLFYVNGERKILSNVEPNMTVLEYLRSIGLTGTKLGCGEGGCGACTIYVQFFDQVVKKIVGRSVNACLAPLCSMDLCAITTVEGLGNVRDGLHPVQQTIADFHGSQCGYCTPGIVMSLYATLETHPEPTLKKIEHSLDGNLCRCTGYRPILDAAKTFAVDNPGIIPNNKNESNNLSSCENNLITPRHGAEKSGCCKSCFSSKEGDSNNIGDIEEVISCTRKKLIECQQKHVPQSEISFPLELKQNVIQCMHIEGNEMSWHRPVSLLELLQLKSRFENQIRIIAGNTEVGIETKFKNQKYPLMVAVSHVPQLHQFEITPHGVHVGAAVTLNELSAFIETKILIHQHQQSSKMNNNMDNNMNNMHNNMHNIHNNNSNNMDNNIHNNIISAERTKSFQAIHAMLQWFASTQIRNVAAIGGNLATASPIADLNPMLMATNAIVTLAAQNQPCRKVPVAEFFLAYRKVDLRKDEVIVSVFIPFTDKYEFVLPFKQAKRRDDDISIVTAGIRVHLQEATCTNNEDNPKNKNKKTVWKIKDCSLAFGGMAPTTVLAKKTMSFLIGQCWNESTIENAFEILNDEMFLKPNVPGGMSEFRMTLCSSFFYKFFIRTSIHLDHIMEDVVEKDGVKEQGDVVEEQGDVVEEQGDGEEKDGVENVVENEEKKNVVEEKHQKHQNKNVVEKESFLSPKFIDSRTVSGGKSFLLDERPLSNGIQKFSMETGGLQHALPLPHTMDEESGEDRAPVGIPMMHKSGYAQVTGEAMYTDDIPTLPGTLYGAFVLSSIPRGKIISVDASKALAMEGVLKFYHAQDILGNNAIGDIVKDEECFLTEEVFAVGQPIGIIVAVSNTLAQEACKLVDVQYEPLSSICSIQEAIALNSYYFSPHVIERGGDLEKGFSEAQVIVEGEINMGGQEHFYLETNATYCVPEEQDTMTVYSSTQNPSKTQSFVAHVLGIPSHKVVCRVKRMGGGFGGKESRSIFISCAVAIAAHHLKKPVKISLDRDVDMKTTGARHAFHGKYRVGALRNGKLVAAELQLYGNAGYSLDLSMPVVDRALFHCENAYMIPHFRATGHVCKTNISSNTAFRGFGGPQGMMICEAYMDHLARELNLSGERVRGLNLYQDGDVTPYGQIIQYCTLERLWKEALQQSELEKRKVEIQQFNLQNRWRKRGISILPTKFGISFTAKFMNQGGALVHVYTDGSVLVSHGGTEMGQGLHTKVIQIAARAFGISDTQVTITETSTDKVPNSSPSAASMSTDLYGMAVLDACEQIKARIAPLARKMPGASFPAIVQAAYFQRINLSAQGFYVVPNERCGYDWDMKTHDNSLRGHPFNYFTMGVAVTEVELDVLSGDIEMSRVDIVLDLGKSINPTIDVGQIEGAFIQGFGLFTMEELVWGDQAHPWVKPGHLFTAGPGTYKIPSFNDVPLDFRISLLKNATNPFAVHSSKAVGEPPLFLGASAFYAIKEAIAASRQEHGIQGPFQLNSPLTSERIRMACGDHLVAKVLDTTTSTTTSTTPTISTTTSTTTVGKQNLASVFQTKGSW